MPFDKLDIQCSNCGSHQSFQYDFNFPKTVPAAGWGSFGRALYCPECAKTWDDRNPGRPMANENNTILAALHHTQSQRYHINKTRREEFQFNNR